MKRKIKCDICGRRFEPSKDKIYVVIMKKENALAEMLTPPNKRFYAQDCPQCGCQMILKERKEKLLELLPREGKHVYD